MPRASTSIQNFAAGELTPKLRGRYDLAILKNGAERMENFISEIQGPTRYRAGFRFAAKTRHNLPARLIEFIYNEEQSYICEFTVGGIRFFVNEGLLVDSTDTITNVTQASPAVVTIASHGYSNGDEVTIFDVAGMTELNGNTYKIANVSTNTFELQTQEGDNIDSTGFTAYSSGGEADHIFSVSNPYTTIEEIFQLNFAQTADTVYFVHREHAPRKLVRTSATAFTFNTYSRTADPYGSSDNYPAAVTIYQQRIYMGGTNNKPLRFDGSQAGNFDDFTTGTADDDGFNFTIASKKISRINSLTSNNKFLAVLSDGGNKSVTGGNDSAITPTNVKIDDVDFLGSAEVNPLVKDNLIILVQQGKRKLRALSYSFEQDGYQPDNLNATADHITVGGVKEIVYQEGSPDVIWAVRDDGKLLGLTYSRVDNVQGWHRHSTGSSTDGFYSAATIPRDTDYEQLWVCTYRVIDGVTRYYIEYLENEPEYPEFIDYFTDENSQESDSNNFQLEMYEKQKQGMYLDSGLTYDGSIQTVTMTAGATTGNSVTFTAGGALFSASDVGRQIWEKNSTGRAEIIAFTSSTVVTCKILKTYSTTDAIAAGDWYLTTGSVSGLSHLEGENVQIVTDGAVHPDKTVSGGVVSLNYQASVVHTGLSYTGLIVTNNIEGGGGNGPAQTKVKNVFKLGIRFNNALGTEYGTNLYRLDKILFRNTQSFTNRPPPLFSGDRVFPVKDNHKREKKLYIRQKVPLACSVQLLMVYLSTSED